MPGYIEAILNRFHHPRPIKPELALHRYASRSFSATNAQAPIPYDDTARLDTSGVLCVQRVVGSILYYARAIDSPLLSALIEIGSDQLKATEETLAATKKSLIFSPHSPTPPSNILPVTSASGLTPTPPLRPYATSVAASAVSFISNHIPPRCQNTMIQPQMDRYLFCVELCKWSCRLQQKPTMAEYS